MIDIFREKNLKQALFLLGWAIFAVSCATDDELATMGRTRGVQSPGRLRAVILEALELYGPVARPARNVFESSRIPTTVVGNLGEEFTLLRVEIEPTSPPKIYVTSDVRARRRGSQRFVPAGKHVELERSTLLGIQARLRKDDPL